VKNQAFFLLKIPLILVMRFILVTTLIFSISTHLSAKEIKVEYKDLSYTVKQDSKKFSFSNKRFKKEYLVNKCNKEQFELFWADYSINKKDKLNVENKKFKPLILTEEGTVLKLNPHSKFGKFLTQVPNKLVSFEINENMKCLK